MLTLKSGLHSQKHRTIVRSYIYIYIYRFRQVTIDKEQKIETDKQV